MTRHLWIVDGIVFERGACGSLRCYHGEAAEVMKLVLKYSGNYQRTINRTDI